MANFAKLLLKEVAETQDMDEKSVGIIPLQGHACWKVYVDSVANQRGSGVGLVLISLEKITIEKSLRLDFSATNNEVEYEALLERMSMVQKLDGKTMNMFSDSRLVVGQVNGGIRSKRRKNAKISKSS